MSLGSLYSVSFERGFSARTLISVAIVAVLLPAMLITGWLARTSAEAERAQIEKNIQQRTHEISAILDREVSGVKGMLTALATSSSLHNGNLQSFHANAVEISQQLELRIFLYDVRDSKVVLTTVTPFGSVVLDGLAFPRALVDRVLAADGPFVTGVTMSPLVKRYGVGVLIPVRTTEQSHYLLGAIIDASKIAQVFELVGLQSPYLAAVIDRTATIIARSSKNEQFAGQPVPSRIKPEPSSKSGTVDAQSAEGVDFRWFYQRSAATNWTVVVGAPDEAFITSFSAMWRVLAMAAVALIAGGLAIAYGLGGWFSRAAFELGVAVRGLPHRHPPSKASSSIREANRLFDDLKVASADLRATDAQERFAIEAAGIGTWTWDLTRGRIIWSKRVREMYRLPPDQEPSADFFLKAVHPADHERILENLRRCLEELAEYKIDFRILNPDRKTFRWVHSDGSVERDAMGTAVSIHGATYDITERKKGEQELSDLRRRLMGAQEAERVRLAHELHDQTGQSLTAALLEVKQVAGAVGGGEGNIHVVRLREQLEEMGKTVHRIARELRPTALEDLGLRAALANHLSDWSATYGLTSDFHFRCGCDEGPDNLPDEIKTAIYRIAQEALTNVAKHAVGATAVSLVVDCGEDLVQMTIEDNGCGFDTTQCPTRNGYSGLGLPGMRERMALVGGSLEIESSPPTGTTIFVRVPVENGRCVA